MGRCLPGVNICTRRTGGWTRVPLGPWVTPTLTSRHAATLPGWRRSPFAPLLRRHEVPLLLDACYPLPSPPTFDEGIMDFLWRVLQLVFFLWDRLPKTIVGLFFLLLDVLIA